MHQGRVFGTELQNVIQNHQNQLIHQKRNFESLKIQTFTQQETIYNNQIFTYLLKNEYSIDCNYMDRQLDIHEKMRSILIDWLIDVHQKFKLRKETLFLNQYIIDKYLSHNMIQRDELQLLGVTALFISSKYEEIYPPNIQDFANICDDAYTKNQILQMEEQIMIALNFNLNYTSPLQYLEKYCKQIKLDIKNQNLAWYLIELSMIDYKMLQYSPIQLAIGAIYLVNKIRLKQSWDQNHQILFQKEEKEIRPCAKFMCQLIQNQEKDQLTAVKRKFSSEEHYQVSKLRLEKAQ